MLQFDPQRITCLGGRKQTLCVVKYRHVTMRCVECVKYFGSRHIEAVNVISHRYESHTTTIRGRDATFVFSTTPCDKLHAFLAP